MITIADTSKLHNPLKSPHVATDSHGDSALLGNNANIGNEFTNSTTCPTDLKSKKSEKSRIWANVAHAQELLTKHNVRGKRRNKNGKRADEEAGPHRTRICHACRSFTADEITIRMNSNGKASLGGVVTCGSAWSCAVCARRIASERGNEIIEAVAFARANKYTPTMITLTAQHTVSMSLDVFKELFKKAWWAFSRSRIWQKFLDLSRRPDEDLLPFEDAVALTLEYFKLLFKSYWWCLSSSKIWKKLLRLTKGIRKFIKAVEPLFNYKNGWHYHYHILVFINNRAMFEPDFELENWKTELEAEWIYQLGRVGLYGKEDVAFDVSVSEKTNAEYLSKLGLSTDNFSSASMSYELSGTVNKNKSREIKRGVTVWTLLERSAGGDSLATQKYLEYVVSMTGENWITWSKHFKKIIGVVEKTDEQIADEDTQTEDWMSLTDDEYSPVRWAKAYGALLHVAESTRDKNMVKKFIAELRFKMDEARLRRIEGLRNYQEDARKERDSVVAKIKPLYKAGIQSRKNDRVRALEDDWERLNNTLKWIKRELANLGDYGS